MIRGDYDRERFRRLTGPLRRAWARARLALSTEDPADRPPTDPSTIGRVHRAGLVALVIGMSATLIAVLTIPGAAVFGRLARLMVSKLDGGPQGLQGVSFKIAQRS